MLRLLHNKYAFVSRKNYIFIPHLPTNLLTNPLFAGAVVGPENVLLVLVRTQACSGTDPKPPQLYAKVVAVLSCLTIRRIAVHNVFFSSRN